KELLEQVEQLDGVEQPQASPRAAARARRARRARTMTTFLYPCRGRRGCRRFRLVRSELRPCANSAPGNFSRQTAGGHEKRPSGLVPWACRGCTIREPLAALSALLRRRRLGLLRQLDLPAQVLQRRVKLLVLERVLHLVGARRARLRPD